MMTQIKSTLSFINHSFCAVTDSMLTNCKNGMCTEITDPCKLRSRNC